MTRMICGITYSRREWEVVWILLMLPTLDGLALLFEMSWLNVAYRGGYPVIMRRVIHLKKKQKQQQKNKKKKKEREIVFFADRQRVLKYIIDRVRAYIFENPVKQIKRNIDTNSVAHFIVPRGVTKPVLNSSESMSAASSSRNGFSNAVPFLTLALSSKDHFRSRFKIKYSNHIFLVANFHCLAKDPECV